jgi:hypothetical protein
MSEIPKAWAELIEALTLLAKGADNEAYPTWCEHDFLHVCAEPSKFTAEEISRLDDLGFWVDDEGGFCSSKFGSA